MSENSDIAYQNKDIMSKVFADKFADKSLKVYGLDIPKIKQVLPTNLPAVSANELRIDNLFLLEDGTIAIIDYESKYKKEDKIKYLNYITRVLERYKTEGKLDIKLRMIVIYTADVKPEEVQPEYNAGTLKFAITPAFLSQIDSKEVMDRLNKKVLTNEPLTDEELMEFIILPLTYKGDDDKKKALKSSIELAKQLDNEELSVFILTGILVFSDKVIDNETAKKVKEWIGMTKVAKLYEAEKDAAIAEKDATIAEKDVEIAAEKAKRAKAEAALAEKDAKIAAEKAENAKLRAQLTALTNA
ncbi:MAG: hypothetical protein ACLTLO_06350 [Coprococcus sp.]